MSIINLTKRYKDNLLRKREAIKNRLSIKILLEVNYHGFGVHYYYKHKDYMLGLSHHPFFLMSSRNCTGCWHDLIEKLLTYLKYAGVRYSLYNKTEGILFFTKQDAEEALDKFAELLILFGIGGE